MPKPKEGCYPNARIIGSLKTPGSTVWVATAFHNYSFPAIVSSPIGRTHNLTVIVDNKGVARVFSDENVKPGLERTIEFFQRQTQPQRNQPVTNGAVLIRVNRPTLVTIPAVPTVPPEGRPALYCSIWAVNLGDGYTNPGSTQKYVRYNSANVFLPGDEEWKVSPPSNTLVDFSDPRYQEYAGNLTLYGTQANPTQRPIAVAYWEDTETEPTPPSQIWWAGGIYSASWTKLEQIEVRPRVDPGEETSNPTYIIDYNGDYAPANNSDFVLTKNGLIEIPPNGSPFGYRPAVTATDIYIDPVIRGIPFSALKYYSVAGGELTELESPLSWRRFYLLNQAAPNYCYSSLASGGSLLFNIDESTFRAFLSGAVFSGDGIEADIAAGLIVTTDIYQLSPTATTCDLTDTGATFEYTFPSVDTDLLEMTTVTHPVTNVVYESNIFLTYMMFRSA